MSLKNLTAEEVLNDDSTSKWLRQALRVSLEDRDIIDALNDIEVLQAVLENELKLSAERIADRVLQLNADKWQINMADKGYQPKKE